MLKRLLKTFFILLFLFAVDTSFVYAANLCNGKEFNRRVKMLLSGGDSNVKKDFSITIFERDYNPPADKAYYVDVSAENDGSVIAYARDNVLAYYSDEDVFINQDLAYMFDGFVRMRNIDLSTFIYTDIKDTRYMFANCHHLKTIKFKTGDINKKKKVKKTKWELVEMQGMFFDCQSLTNIDLSRFDVSHVENMNEVFYKCYNIKNIYVDKESWKVSNVYTCNKMFAECHLLKTNFGRKASDVATDDYLKYAIAGSGKDDTVEVEGFLKDTATEYADYGEREKAVPIDGDDYSIRNTSPTITYEDEPEGDGGIGQGGEGEGIGIGEGGNGDGNGSAVETTPYVGDKSTGYNAEKEQMVSDQIIVQNIEQNPIDMTETSETIVETSEIINEQSVEVSESIVETVAVETENNIEIVESLETVDVNDVVETSPMQSEIVSNTIENEISETNTKEIIESNEIITETNTTEEIETSQNVEVETTKEIINSIENNISDNEETKQQRIIELDEYLKQQGLERRSGDGDGKGGVNEEADADINYQFLIFALIVSTIAILLLVGAIMFLVQDKKENDKKLIEDANKDKSSNEDVTNDKVINKEMSKSESKVLSNEMSKDISKKTSKNISDNISSNISNNTSNNISKKTSKSISKVASQEKKANNKKDKSDSKKKGQKEL